MAVKNVLLTMEYDGTRFCGWQRQPNQRTVQGLLEDTLSRVLNQTITVDGTSRTDAGVHALGQCCTFQADYGLPVEKLPLVVNNVLRGRTPQPDENSDLRIISAREMDMDFHARYQCEGKTYKYVIWNSKDMPVFKRNYRWHVEPELDVDLMNEAASYLVGTHDFQCFQAAGSNPRLTTVRQIWNASVVSQPLTRDFSIPVKMTGGNGVAGQPLTDENNQRMEYGDKEITIYVTGDGFLYNMVRIVAGTLVEVGKRRMRPEAIKDIIEGMDRQAAGPTAPPQGLYLQKIYYDHEQIDRLIEEMRRTW